jgi:putative ATPase
MKQLEYGKGYRYAHDEPEAIAAMDCLPPSLQGRQYYTPKQRGYEKEIARRLERWEEIKQQRRAAASTDRPDSPDGDERSE